MGRPKKSRNAEDYRGVDLLAVEVEGHAQLKQYGRRKKKDSHPKFPLQWDEEDVEGYPSSNAYESCPCKKYKT